MYQENYPNSFNITHRPGDNDYKDLIIRPSQMKKETRTYILVVDSRDRNTTKFPNPAKYTLDLNNHYKDIVEVELLSAFVPKSEYTITTGVNDTLYLKMGDTSYNLGSDNVILDSSENPLAIPVAKDANIHKISVPAGLYNKSDLGDALEYNLKLVDTHFKVSYSKFLDKYTISNEGNFQLLFYSREDPHGSYEYIKNSTYTYAIKEVGGTLVSKFSSFQERLYYMRRYLPSTEGRTGDVITINDVDYAAIEPYLEEVFIGEKERQYPKSCIGKMLGFNNVNLAGNTQYQAQNRPHLDGESYILLKIPQFHRYHSHKQVVHKSFAKIPLLYSYDFEHTKNYGNSKRFNPPLHKLDKLHISFVTREGRLYDFNGKEHVLNFAITVRSQSNKYYPTNI
jgi:hypothetical protein